MEGKWVVQKYKNPRPDSYRDDIRIRNVCY